MSIELAQAARLEKLLNEKFRFGGEVYDWRTLAESGMIVRKELGFEYYARRKVNLEYKKLAQPKPSYRLFTASNTFIETNKTVFDWFPCQLG